MVTTKRPRQSAKPVARAADLPKLRRRPAPRTPVVDPGQVRDRLEGVVAGAVVHHQDLEAPVRTVEDPDDGGNQLAQRLRLVEGRE